MKKLSYLIVLTLILGLVLTGCFLSNVGQVPTSEQSGIAYLTKNSSPPVLVGLWHFDGNADDSSGYGNDGTLHNFVSPHGWVSGMFGQALSFDGLVNNYVDCWSSSSLDFTTDVTIEAWVYPKSDTSLQMIVDNRNVTASGVQLFYRATTNRIEIQINNARAADGNVPTNWLDNWHHVLATYTSGVGGSVYIDGINVSQNVTDRGDMSGAGRITVIGARYTKATLFFDGIIDEVRIWDTATPNFNLNLDPKLDFNPVGTDHIVTATVTIDVDGGTEPAPGVLVDFTVSGVNDDTDSVFTDSNGEVTFTYTGDGGAGEDTIMATLNYPFYQATPNYVDKYWLENFVTGGGKINKSTLDLPGKGTALTFAGTIGVLEGEGIVGQFQIVDHTGLIRKGAVSWHCNNSFSFLNFEGGSAESPEATHDTATFKGEFVSNLGDTETLRLRIIDNGEPGARVDKFSIWFFGDWREWTIDGGNFQVHNIED